MSAPHSIDFDVFFNDQKIDSFNLDVDLDLPTEIFEEVSKLFPKPYASISFVFRFSEFLALSGRIKDFVLEDLYCEGQRGTLRLVVTDVKDWG